MTEITKISSMIFLRCYDNANSILEKTKQTHMNSCGKNILFNRRKIFEKLAYESFKYATITLY